MNYYIFRHGYTKESSVNAEYDPERVFSAEIIPERREVVEKLARYLKKIPTDINVSSPYLRCKQTVEIVSQISGKQFVFDNCLGEYVFQHGEKFTEMSTRIKNFVGEIESQKYNSVAICTHGGIISALKHWILEGKYEPQDLTDYPRSGVLMIIQDNKLQLVDFN